MSVMIANVLGAIEPWPSPAFTPYATCPVPPKENALPIRIEAGEKNPHR